MVFEGCDRVGKSTQVKLLEEALNKRKIPAVRYSFPNRTTAVGKLLDSFLSKKQDLPGETAHLLFSANRWECRDNILETLENGTTLIVDRYAASGAAYTSAVTGKCLSWCKQCDKGLPSPDMVVLLNVTAETQRLRTGWGNERFEKLELQRKVAENYEKLMDKSWTLIDANQDVQKMHEEILQYSLEVIEKVQETPVSILYESSENN